MLCSCLLACTGCGYHFAQRDGLESSLAIPFISGDRDGFFTEMLIHQVTLQTPFVYSQGDAKYILSVVLLDIDDTNIGFRYDRHKRKKRSLKHNIIPTEMRLEACAEVTLALAATGEGLLGPIKIEASVELDHDYYNNNNAINVFSLGQLGDVDAAREAALRPLAAALATNIAEFLKRASFMNSPAITSN